MAEMCKKHFYFCSASEHLSCLLLCLEQWPIFSFKEEKRLNVDCIILFVQFKLLFVHFESGYFFFFNVVNAVNFCLLATTSGNPAATYRFGLNYIFPTIHGWPFHTAYYSAWDSTPRWSATGWVGEGGGVIELLICLVLFMSRKAMLQFWLFQWIFFLCCLWLL